MSCIFNFQLTKEYLEQISKVSGGSEASMSCIESSGDEYILSKDSIHESSSEGPYDLTSKVPLVKLKKQAGTPVKASDYMHCINCEALLKRKSLWRQIHVQVQAFTKMQHNKARQKSDPITLCLCTARTRWF